MAHVVRLQNLPNSAGSADVRSFLKGFDIPNGGVKIVGGERGDCFIVFNNFSDANASLSRDGSWLNDQRVRLFPSSAKEMDHVIAVAKGEIPPTPPDNRFPDSIRMNKPQDWQSRNPPPNSFNGRQPYNDQRNLSSIPASNTRPELRGDTYPRNGDRQLHHAAPTHPYPAFFDQPKASSDHPPQSFNPRCDVSSPNMRGAKWSPDMPDHNRQKPDLERHVYHPIVEKSSSLPQPNHKPPVFQNQPATSDVFRPGFQHPPPTNVVSATSSPMPPMMSTRPSLPMPNGRFSHPPPSSNNMPPGSGSRTNSVTPSQRYPGPNNTRFDGMPGPVGPSSRFGDQQSIAGPNRSGMLSNQSLPPHEPPAKKSVGLLPTPVLVDHDSPSQPQTNTFRDNGHLPYPGRPRDGPIPLGRQVQGPASMPVTHPHFPHANHIPDPMRIGPPVLPDMPPRPLSPIRITDPCAVLSQLPPRTGSMQLKGLFATHSLVPIDMVFVRPPFEDAFTKAYVLFSNVDETVLALNELADMKICGQRFDIKPCSLEEFHSVERDRHPQDRRGEQQLERPPPGGHGVETGPSHYGRTSREQQLERPPPGGHGGPSHYGRTSREGDNRPLGDGVRRRRPSPSRPNSRDYEHSRDHSRRPSERSRSPRPRSERRRRSREREDRRHRRSSSRDKRTRDPLQELRFKSKSADTTEKPGLCVLMSGLPPKTSRHDLVEYLKDYNYVQESLYLELNVHEECTGTAYVELATEDSYNGLLSSQPDISNQPIHISGIAKEQMRRLVELHRSQRAADKTKPGEFILQLVGLPYEATPRTVKEFLYPAKVKDGDIKIMKRPDGTGRCSGNAFAKVTSIDDRDRALKHDKGYIGKRYVCVKVVSQVFMDDFVAKEEAKMSTYEQQVNDAGLGCEVSLANLRYDAKPQDIEAFFREFEPEAGSVKFIMNNGMPTGRGTIRLKSAEMVRTAIQALNKKELAGRNVILTPATL